ncbi:MAG: alanine dehydrogenase [Nitrospirales bacterium]|nr:alanine dehydrogenase [Nitrospirales bacterium]
MNIGIPKEVKDHEFRVALTPTGVQAVCQRGHRAWVESGAGQGSGFSDEAYQEAGATVTTSKEDVFQHSELILKVKEPLLSECALLRPEHTLLTFFHLAANKELTDALLNTGVTAIAYETVEDQQEKLPILYPMSVIAGRMSVQIGAHYLTRNQYGGQGIVMSGVPGVAPAHVVILGAGVVGVSAARIASGMGARVTVISLDLEQLQVLDAMYQGRIATLAAHQGWIDHAVEQADLVIGAVMVRGAKTPQIVSRSVVSRMSAGSVIVDVAVDQGGCVETTKPTTHSEPVSVVNEVVHYGVTNIPGIVPRTATDALTNATLPFIVQLADSGIERALRDWRGLAKGVNVKQGTITCQAVADAHGLTCHSLF